MRRFRGRWLFGLLAAWILWGIAKAGWNFLGPVSWFGSATQQRLFAAAFLLWCGTEVVIWGRSAVRKDPAVRQRDRDTLLLVVAAVWVSVWLQFYLRALGVWMLPPFWYYPGIALLVLGILLRLWAVRTLGRFFSTRVEIRADHRLVREGPYRWVRHPAYTGSLLSITGVALALRSGAGAVAALLLAGAAFRIRMEVEERALEEELGPQYAEYRSKTRRLLPWIY